MKQAFLWLFSLSVFTMNAQNLEMGKVTIANLQEKFHPLDSSAVAAFIFNKGEVYVSNEYSGFDTSTKVKIRIKIYKKEGYEWANHKVVYYSHFSSPESVKFTDAVTYNLVNGQIVTTKVKSDGILDSRIDKYLSTKQIIMPDVKEGSIIEFQYLIRNQDLTVLQDWDFQTEIPVNYSEYTTEIPDYFTYGPKFKGYLFATRSVEKRANYEKVKYVMTNVPSIKEEAYVNNIENYITSISHELIRIDFPGMFSKSYAKDWPTYTKLISELDDFGPELRRTGYFDDAIDALIAGLDTPEKKMTAIFNFVKEKVKWNKYYGFTCDEGVKTAFKTGTGNVAEINLMLVSMLRYAGVDANPVLISTRDNGVSFFPNRRAFNYVIGVAEINDRQILLDATEKFSQPDVLPLRDLNWYGRIVKKDGSSSDIKLLPAKSSKEIVNGIITINEKGAIDGKIKKQLTDYIALDFRQENQDVTNEKYLDELESENKISVSDYKRENDTDPSKPIIETIIFTDSDNIEVIGDKTYLNPLLFLNEKTNPFRQEKREYPVDFGYPSDTTYNITFQIPQSYTIESIPENILLTTENSIGSFKYNISKNGNNIQVAVRKNITAPIIPAESYEILKVFYREMIEKQTEKIVLKKI